jgi:hypothetical protein
LGHYLHLLSYNQGMARKGGDYGSAELNLLGPSSGGSEHRQAVQPRASGGHPCGVYAQFFSPLDGGLYVLNFVPAYCESDPAHLLPHCFTSYDLEPGV